MQNKKTYKWGTIGLGHIAGKFADALAIAGNAVLEAVASRELRRAEQFGKEHGARKTYGSYEALAKDPDIDAVYIATPHAFHADLAMLCLRRGKAVLCEKPMALNYWQVKTMTDSAKANNAFMMEVMWTRFLPATEKMLELVQQGAIGDIHTITADFCFNAPFDPQGRLYNPALGGGALLDVGIYPLFLALLLLGRPKKIRARAKLSVTGVDESCQAVLQ